MCSDDCFFCKFRMNHKPFTCRFCLIGKDKGVNLFDRDLLLNPNLHSWINVTFGLKINEEDGLPKNVCMSCILFVYQAYFFIRKCQESENILTRDIEARAETDCIISMSKSGMKSDIARGNNSRNPIQDSSPSTTQDPVKNESWNGISSRANENSVHPTYKKSTLDHLLPFGVEKKVSSNNDALPVSCPKSSQQRQQEVKEECAYKTAGGSNLEYERNQIGTQCNNDAESMALHPSESQDCSCRSFQSTRDQKLVQCLCNHSFKAQSTSEDDECTLNCDEESHQCSEKQGQFYKLSDDIDIIEPCQEIISKKSAFHVEFIKYLNSNACQSDHMVDTCKDMDSINLKKELIETQGIEPEKNYDYLQSKGKLGNSKDRSHGLGKFKNPCITLDKVTSNMLLSDGSGKSDVCPSFGCNISHHSLCAIKPVPENKHHACSPLKETVYATASVFEENYTKPVDTRSVHLVPRMETDGVNLEQPYETLNDSISERHSKQFLGTPEKNSFFEVNNMPVTSSLPSPVQKNSNAPIGLKVESNFGKEEYADNHSCVKAARIMINEDHSTMLCSEAGKVSKQRMKPSLPVIKQYNQEPEYSLKGSPIPGRNLPPLFTKRKTPQFKELDTKLDTVSRPLSRSSISLHAESFPHSDQSHQHMLKESVTSRSLKEEKKKFSGNKNSFMDDITKCSRIIGNNESSLEFQHMRHTISEDVFQQSNTVDVITHGKRTARHSNSSFFEGKSVLVGAENLGIEGKNIVSMRHQGASDQEYLEHQCSFRETGKKASNNVMKVEMDSSSVMENGDREKLQISFSPKVTCIQLKSSTPCVSNFGKGDPIDKSYKDSSNRLFNHDSPSMKHTPSITQGNSLTKIPSVNGVQSSNVLANVSSISKAKITLNSNKPFLNGNSLRKKKQRNRRRIPRKRKIKESLEKLKRISFTFPCSICSKIFSNHDLMLKHLLTHSENHTRESFVNDAPLKPKIPKLMGNFMEVDNSIGQQEALESKIFTSIGAVKDEKIDEIRAIIKQHLIVNDSGSLNGDCKSFRCPACFKFIPDWFEVTMHIVLHHSNLSSEWPMSFLFSPKIFYKLTNKHLDRSKLTGTVMQLPLPEIPLPQTVDPSTLNSCEHCCKQFSSNSALLKHLIWAHNKSS